MDTAMAEGGEEHLEVGAVPFQALHDHWERTRWSLGDLDYAVDRESFAALDAAGQDRMRWLFTHRFDGEATVARLMTPFVTEAPDLDVELLMATQLVDEVRHVKAIVRIYDEVLGVPGGVPAVQALADRMRDPLTGRLYARLERWIAQLAAEPTPDNYLRAVVAYHLLGEGVVARVSTRLSTPVFRGWGAFPGILAGQRLVSRDESRHIGIGVTYVRREVARDADRAIAIVGEVLFDSVALFGELAGTAAGDTDLSGTIGEHYGATPQQYLAEATRLIGIRLRSVGAGRLLAAA